MLIFYMRADDVACQPWSTPVNEALPAVDAASIAQSPDGMKSARLVDVFVLCAEASQE
jgi:hypothetical protein